VCLFVFVMLLFGLLLLLVVCVAVAGVCSLLFVVCCYC